MKDDKRMFDLTLVQKLELYDQSMPRKKGPSCQANSIASPSTGRSDPNKSIKSVCSERFILVSGKPEIEAIVDTRDVFPMPGLPSSSIGLDNCIARKIRIALKEVIGAHKL
ncbi:unnamed protein product [Pneumocystis jirovecii]|uniref:Uncharacterized protein n=1 Tax=Pneumocystis jirovecii TaxID=42068 RepID=L0PFU8_PNEJI|nr:unnamed protein product [Pneumocystis jirovecii]